MECSTWNILGSNQRSRVKKNNRIGTIFYKMEQNIEQHQEEYFRRFSNFESSD